MFAKIIQMVTDLRVNNGGARKGAGRKPVKDKKNYVLVWLRNSLIKSKGGKKPTQRKIEKILEEQGWNID